MSNHNVVTLSLAKMMYYIANRFMHDLAHDLHPSGIGYNRILNVENQTRVCGITPMKN